MFFYSFAPTFHIHEQFFISLGVSGVSLGRPDLCKVLCPFVAALKKKKKKRQLSMTAFFCGSRFPLPKQQVLPTIYHYRALGDPGLKTSAEYQYIHFKNKQTRNHLLF